MLLKVGDDDEDGWGVGDIKRTRLGLRSGWNVHQSEVIRSWCLNFNLINNILLFSWSHKTGMNAI